MKAADMNAADMSAGRVPTGSAIPGELFCHEDNVVEFNAALRAQPELRAFVSALYQAGMIDGLRGARLRPVSTEHPAPDSGATPVLSYAAEKRLSDRAWQLEQAERAKTQG